MRREFPNILDHDKEDHPVIFIPPNLMFNEFSEKVMKKIVSAVFLSLLLDHEFLFKKAYLQ
jgi:hypothetical protein